VVLNFNLAKGENIVRIRASSRVGCTVALTVGRSREVFARSDGKESKCELSVVAKQAMTVELELYRVMGSTLSYEGEILRK
jgi:hypothetical protein